MKDIKIACLVQKLQQQTIMRVVFILFTKIDSPNNQLKKYSSRTIYERTLIPKFGSLQLMGLGQG